VKAVGPPRVKRLIPGAILGLAIGTLGLLVSVLPFWQALEEQVGLGLLFSLRGSLPAPDDVVVVSIDQFSADALGELPADPAKWPHSLHARLTENLTRAGAKVIAFDVFFAEVRSAEDDARFADAIAHARNVVLAKHLARATVPLDRHDASGTRLNVERLASPAPILAGPAVGAAPFPLPKVPVRLSQYWKFTSAAGGVPTLPVVAFQVFGLEAYGDLVRLAATVRPDLASALPPDAGAVLAAGRIESVVLKLRALFEVDPTLGDAMLEAASTDGTEHLRLLQALIKMYQGPDSEHLNFYGPPGTVRSVPYHEVVSARAVADPGRLHLQGKAVFVGLSDYLRPEQKDGFHTVFSRAGVDLSGAEIAATAFANLLDDQHVRPLDFLGQVIVVLGGGILVGGLCAVLAPGAAALTALGLGAAYLAVALSRFTVAHTWYPIAGDQARSREQR
jgi:adenylate cyclase